MSKIINTPRRTGMSEKPKMISVGTIGHIDHGKSTISSAAKAIVESTRYVTEDDIGPFFLHHPESCCVFVADTVEERDEYLENIEISEVTEATYQSLQAEYGGR